MSDLSWMPIVSFLEPSFSGCGWTGWLIGGPPLPMCWGFVLPVFIGFLLSLPHVFTSGLVIAGLVALAGLTLLGLWALTGIYQLNRLGVACLASAGILLCGRLMRWARRRLAMVRGRVPLKFLRREDEGWAGFAPAWLGELSSRGVEITPGFVTRSGASGSEARLSLDAWADADARGKLLTSNVLEGAYHRAILTMEGSGREEIDKLGSDRQGERWRRLAAILEGVIGEPASATIEAREGRIRLAGIEKVGWGTGGEWWTSVGLGDLDPHPMAPLEESLEDLHGPLWRILFAPYLRLGILGDEEARGLARRVEGRVFLSTRLLAILARAGFPGRDDATQAVLRLAGAYGRWTREARRTAEARPGAGASTEALARWIYGRALPDLHCLAFLEKAILGAGTEGLSDPARLGEALAPEARGWLAFQRDAKAVLEAPARDRDEALRSFLGKYGHLGPRDRSLHEPRLGDDPVAAVDWLGRNLPNAARPNTRASAPLAIRLDPRIHLAAWISRIQAGLRDAILRASWDLRKELLALGGAAASAGVLFEPADVFFLDAAELAALGAGDPERLAAVVRERRARFVEMSARPYPAFIHEPGSGAPSPSLQPAVLAPGETLRGTPSSPGRAAGRAWIAVNPLGPDLPPEGSILVLPGAGPEWALLLGRVAGVVVDRGGALSHLAIVSREMGVPAVMGLVAATTRITTGMEIEIDGDEGSVKRAAPPGP